MTRQRMLVLEEIAAKVESRHEENLRRFDTIDSGQFDINVKLDSLLASRSYMRGVVRTVILMSTGISAVVSLFVAWIKH